jgi:predicted DNA-binding ArsR family transcriptional regulator
MSKKYSDRQINSMITFLRVKKIAEVQYIDRQFVDGVKEMQRSIDSGDYTLYDYISNSHITLSQVISSAIEKGWKEDWVV